MEEALTKATFERLKRELEELKTVGRVQAAQAIEQARALGDLSENGDYHAAKDNKARLESRIAKLESLLENAKIIERECSSEVQLGSVVSLRYEGENEIERYFLGSIEEKVEGTTVISPNSPLGTAILGKTRGDIITYESPAGPLRVEIVEIH